MVFLFINFILIYLKSSGKNSQFFRLIIQNVNCLPVLRASTSGEDSKFLAKCIKILIIG